MNTTYFCRCCFTKDLDSNNNIINKYFTTKTKQKFIKHLTSPKHIKNKKALDELPDDKVKICPFTGDRIALEAWESYFNQNAILLQHDKFQEFIETKEDEDIKRLKKTNTKFSTYLKFKHEIDDAIDEGLIKPDNYTIEFGSKLVRATGMPDWLKLYACRRKKIPISKKDTITI